ncbi:putative integral membrane protein [Actinokineospora spheciospongiae]|uniref:Putative integral membrane protein n=1 Tax=Actinokineospora spheciospongiae TaxID=909613 RepID=W7IT37_9PSEU|nr:putative integral membrane protein [Actinokineospora spheciospongiae]
MAGLRRPATPADEAAESPLVDPADLTASTPAAETGPHPADRATDVDEAAEPASAVTGGVLGAPAAETPADDTTESRTTESRTTESRTTEPGTAEPGTTAGSRTGTGAAEVATSTTAEQAAKTAATGPKAKAAPATADRPTPGRRPAGKRKAESSLVGDRREDTRERPAAAARKPRKPSRTTAARSGMNAAIVLAVVALVLAGLALWFKGKSDSLTAGADADNSAVTDVRATEELKNKLKSAIERTLSYNFADLDATAKAVQETLTDRAVCDYNALYGKIRELAPQEKLVLSTKVRDIGVVSLRGSEAEALVFVDQTTTRAAATAGAEGQTVASGAQFAVRARSEGDVWKITAFDMLNQPLPGGQSTANC